MPTFGIVLVADDEKDWRCMGGPLADVAAARHVF